MYIIVLQFESSIFKENFVPLNDVHQYNTRGSRFNFLVPHCRSVDSSTFLYPRKLCLWEGILFSSCPTVRVSVTFCFLNNFKNH